MDAEHFNAAMTPVFAAFQKTPSKDVLAAIYERVKGLSDGFLEYAAARLKNMEKLPANVGRELVLLHPDYLAEAFGGACLQADCPDCGGSGWLRLRRPGAAPSSATTLVPCICNTTATAMFPELPVRARTLNEMLRAGWTEARPALPAGTPDAAELRRRIRKKVEGMLEEFARRDVRDRELAGDPMEEGD